MMDLRCVEWQSETETLKWLLTCHTTTTSAFMHTESDYCCLFVALKTYEHDALLHHLLCCCSSYPVGFMQFGNTIPSTFQFRAGCAEDELRDENARCTFLTIAHFCALIIKSHSP